MCFTWKLIEGVRAHAITRRSRRLAGIDTTGQRERRSRPTKRAGVVLFQYSRLSNRSAAYDIGRAGCYRRTRVCSTRRRNNNIVRRPATERDGGYAIFAAFCDDNDGPGGDITANTHVRQVIIIIIRFVAERNVTLNVLVGEKHGNVDRPRTFVMYRRIASTYTECTPHTRTLSFYKCKKNRTIA